MKETVIR